MVAFLGWQESGNSGGGGGGLKSIFIRTREAKIDRTRDDGGKQRSHELPTMVGRVKKGRRHPGSSCMTIYLY